MYHIIYILTFPPPTLQILGARKFICWGKQGAYSSHQVIQSTFSVRSIKNRLLSYKRHWDTGKTHRISGRTEEKTHVLGHTMEAKVKLQNWSGDKDTSAMAAECLTWSLYWWFNQHWVLDWSPPLQPLLFQQVIFLKPFFSSYLWGWCAKLAEPGPCTDVLAARNVGKKVPSTSAFIEDDKPYRLDS